MKIVAVIAGILLIQLLFWGVALLGVKRKSKGLAKTMAEQCRSNDQTFEIPPTSALFRGSDAKFGNVKGNGVALLTEDSFVFEKLTGQTIRIDLSDIADASVEETFKGKPSFGTGGKHLVVRTTDGNRIGFLVRDAEGWVNKIKSVPKRGV